MVAGGVVYLATRIYFPPPAAGPSKTRPVWLVPRKNPESAFCFWSSAPLKRLVRPVLGSTAVPLNRPEEEFNVNVSWLGLRVVILPLVPKATRSVKDAGRMPPANESSPVFKFNIGMRFVKA